MNANKWLALAALGTLCFGLGACETGALSRDIDNGSKVDPDLPVDPEDNNDTVIVDPDNPDEVLRITDPGRVTIRRLIRTEYNNTIRDLLGVNDTPADIFPPDDFSPAGFNTNADFLSVSDAHVKLYEEAADGLIDKVMNVSAGTTSQRFEASEGNASTGGERGDFWNLWSNGELGKQITFAEAGDYKFSVIAGQDKAGPDNAQMELVVNNNVVHTFDVDALRGSPKVYTYTAPVDAGTFRVALRFINDFNDPGGSGDRNLYVGWTEIEGPLNVTVSSPERERIMVCAPSGADDSACLGQIISEFGQRAWRRPLETSEVDRLLQFVGVALAQDDGWEEGLKLALKAMLLSPKFIYRVEREQKDKAQTPYELTAHELATRLSYFLWSSMPDRELMDRAADGSLLDDDVLAAQVDRMLADDKAQAIVDGFGVQWLFLDNVLSDDVDPSSTFFPDFDRSILAQLRQESYLFVSDWLRKDTPLSELLQAEHSFMNEAVAAHYGIEGVEGEAFQRVALDPAGKRRGFLSHASFLTHRSKPTRTSPTLRGVWIMEQMMCDAPPPPPPGVEGVNEDIDQDQPWRQIISEHSETPACYSCHKVMDNIGFGLEHYDPVGRWRDAETREDEYTPGDVQGPYAIDPEGVLPDGRSFTDVHQLADVITQDEKYVECLTEKAMGWGLGRAIEGKNKTQPDYAAMKIIAHQVEQSGATTHSMLKTIALSKLFRTKRNTNAKEEQEVQDILDAQ